MKSYEKDNAQQQYVKLVIQLDERAPVGTYTAYFSIFHKRDHWTIDVFEFTLEVIEKPAPLFENWEPELDLMQN